MTESMVGKPFGEQDDPRPGKNASAPDQIGRRLREARTARGISLREMARRIKVSPSFVSQVERGKANPSVGTLYAFVSELGVSLDDLTAERFDPDRVATAADGLTATADAPMSWDPRTAAWPRIGAPVRQKKKKRTKE
jgi:transcriptional regulator with XRE-family HTH domain